MDSNLRQTAEKTNALTPNSIFVNKLALAKPLANKGELKRKFLIGVTRSSQHNEFQHSQANKDALY